MCHEKQWLPESSSSLDDGGGKCWKIRCPRIWNLELSKVVLWDCDNDDFFGSTCVPRCHPGYSLDNNNNDNNNNQTLPETTCLSNGSWSISLSSFSCSPVNCGRPNVISSHLEEWICTNDYEFGSRCRLICDKGFYSDTSIQCRFSFILHRNILEFTCVFCSR